MKKWPIIKDYSIKNGCGETVRISNFASIRIKRVKSIDYLINYMNDILIKQLNRTR